MERKKRTKGDKDKNGVERERERGEEEEGTIRVKMNGELRTSGLKAS